MTRLHRQAWPSRAGEGSAGADRRGPAGPDGSALDPEGASPGWREKLGVSLFRARGEEGERPGYCVLQAHTLPWLSL